MFFPASQAIGRLSTGQCLVNCRSSLPLSLSRVKILYRLLNPKARCYAASKPVSRPKAHTGRTTSTRKPKAAAAPKAKTSARKSSATVGKPVAKKKAKRPKTKAKAKAKIKVKPKPRKKPLTEEGKAKLAAKKRISDVKALKELALKPPSPGQANAWLAYHVEKSKGRKGPLDADRQRALSVEFKNLSTEQREHYNHIANQNRAAYVLEYRKWIESHSPDMIRKANNARLLLKRRGVHGRWLKLQDDRQVKGTMTAYLFFFVDRRASGDFAHISVQEATKRIAQEWKDLSTEEKQVYVERQKQDQVRHDQEVKSVFNRDVKRQKPVT